MKNIWKHIRRATGMFPVWALITWIFCLLCGAAFLIATNGMFAEFSWSRLAFYEATPTLMPDGTPWPKSGSSRTIQLSSKVCDCYQVALSYGGRRLAALLDTPWRVVVISIRSGRRVSETLLPKGAVAIAGFDAVGTRLGVRLGRDRRGVARTGKMATMGVATGRFSASSLLTIRVAVPGRKDVGQISIRSSAWRLSLRDANGRGIWNTYLDGYAKALSVSPGSEEAICVGIANDAPENEDVLFNAVGEGLALTFVPFGRIWSVRLSDGHARTLQKSRSVFSGVCASQDGRFIAITQSWDPHRLGAAIRICRSASLKTLASLVLSPAFCPGQPILFSHDGNMLAVCGNSAERHVPLCEVWNIGGLGAGDAPRAGPGVDEASTGEVKK